MPYAIRNSIILTVLIVLFTGAGGGYIYFVQTKKIESIEKERKQIREQLGDVRDLYNRLASAQERVNNLNEGWGHRPKTLPSLEVASRTNQYINEILAQGSDLDLNVFTQEKVEQDGCGYLRYHVAGQGSFEDFAKFVQYLEMGPRLMKLRNVDIREIHTLDDKLGILVHTVQFDADLLAFYSEQTPFADSVYIPTIAEMAVPSIAYNPFRSLINPEIPPNVYDLPDVEKSTLLAVMKGRAFISDQHNQLVMLTEGDEIYLGYVSRIMPERRQVLFLLNKGGIIERFVLTLRFENKLEDFKK